MNEAELRREFDHWYDVHHISEDSHKDAAWQAYQLGYEAGQKDGPEEERVLEWLKADNEKRVEADKDE